MARKHWKGFAFWTIALVVIAIIALLLFISQPVWVKAVPSPLSADSQRMEKIVRTLSEDYFPRNHRSIANLNQTRDFISSHFQHMGCQLSYQSYPINDNEYSNISCLFNPGKGPRLIVGAHYDSYAKTPGADDNASGIAGLIEIGYLLSKADLNTEVELVAYTLEEPPFFGTTSMGSYYHALSLADQHIPVAGVFVLEMIGYFDETYPSQDYPLSLLKVWYPNRGNFIGVIGNMAQRDFTKAVKRSMASTTELAVYSINAPGPLSGIDFSDHRNYWEFGFPAIMITDTAFYRNRAYHQPNDTWDRLNYRKMGLVAVAVFEAVKAVSAKAEN